jgi:hypothetical protein
MPTESREYYQQDVLVDDRDSAILFRSLTNPGHAWFNEHMRGAPTFGEYVIVDRDEALQTTLRLLAVGLVLARGNCCPDEDEEESAFPSLSDQWALCEKGQHDWLPIEAEELDLSPMHRTLRGYQVCYACEATRETPAVRN